MDSELRGRDEMRLKVWEGEKKESERRRKVLEVQKFDVLPNSPFDSTLAWVKVL